MWVYVCALAALSLPGSLLAQNSARRSSAGGAAKASASEPARPKEELLAAVERLTLMLEQQSRDLEIQRAALREQQEKTAALERRLEQLLAAARAPVATQTAVVAVNALGDVATGPDQSPQQTESLADRVAKLEGSVAAAQKTSESKWKNLGNFAFSGDVRLRYEPFFGGGIASSPAPDSRHRPRMRARFNVLAKFNDEWSGGLTLASGSDTDPISTNQTMDKFFERKPINIDRAFVQYKPGWAKALLHNTGEFTLTAGKFGATWYRTEMVLDNDVNPEGVSEVLDFKVRTAALKRLVFVGFQLPFNEVSSGPDSFLQGGQFQSYWQFGDRVRFSAYAGFYDWNRTDPIRAAQTAGGLSGSSNRHAATATQFASKFGVLDLIARWDIATASPRWPLMLQFDFATNTRACSNLANIPGPLPACNPRDRHAHWMEVQLGQTREVGDLNFGYTFARVEREAVLGAFNFSDLRAPTNVTQHRINFGYQAYRNVTLNFTGFFGRQLTTSTSAEERILKRLQMDVIYKF